MSDPKTIMERREEVAHAVARLQGAGLPTVPIGVVVDAVRGTLGPVASRRTLRRDVAALVSAGRLLERQGGAVSLPALPLSPVVSGDFREVLAGVRADVLITDIPFDDTTHEGNSALPYDRSALPYGAADAGLCADLMRMAVEEWRVGWALVFCARSQKAELDALARQAGRYVFAESPVWESTRRRHMADGPPASQIVTHLSRPRSAEFVGTFGSLPGVYRVPRDRGMLPGGKPLELMCQIVADYSRPWQIVIDPCAGLGRTGEAAVSLGRRFIGAELDPERAPLAAARVRVAAGYRAPHDPSFAGVSPYSAGGER